MQPSPMLYLDHNATSPLCDAARQAWLEAQERFFANPSSLHRAGQRAERALEDARDCVAHLLQCSASELIWTSGATEAANSVFASLAASTQGTLLMSPFEHPCVLESARRWFSGRCHFLRSDSSGCVDGAEVQEALNMREVAAVVIMAANNETGVFQPWNYVARTCAEKSVPFVCDATQWVGRMPLDGLQECAYVFASTHKAGGPVGSGFLKIPGSHQRNLKIKPPWNPFLVGGPQEDARRAGTQNVAGAVALAATLLNRQTRLLEITAKTDLRRQTELALKESVKELEIISESAERLWNTIPILLPAPPDCRRRWVVRLDAAGIAASSGSACSSGKEAPSHVLRAMGLEACADRVVRLSSGWDTSAADWAHAVSVIRRITAEELGRIPAA